MDLVLILLVIWLAGLTVAIFLLDSCQKNQADLLYKLRNDINKTSNGHIFCKSVDKDFNTNCKGITLKDMDMGEKP